MTDKTMANGVTQLAMGVAQILGRTSEERAIVDGVADVLRRVLADGLALKPAYMQPLSSGYVMYPLYIAGDDSFSIASAVWNVGQTTPIHDHGVWGVVGILQGVEREERFAPPEQGFGAVQYLGMDEFKPGEVTVCCTTDRDLHRVATGTDEACVGIHIYGGNIWNVRRRAYHPETGEVTYFVSDRPETPVAVLSGGAG